MPLIDERLLAIEMNNRLKSCGVIFAFTSGKALLKMCFKDLLTVSKSLLNSSARAINVGKTLKEMIAQDVKDEERAITLHKQIVELAQKEADVTIAFLFMEILKDEEDHHGTFTTLLEQVQRSFRVLLFFF